jgi:glycosyltransferase involved in cell wall biosynthesis
MFHGFQLLPFLSWAAYWAHPLYRSACKLLANARFPFVWCHDFYTLPLGAKVLEKNGTLLVDVHEHAVTQSRSENFFKNAWWFFARRRYIHALQKKYLPQATHITTVCDGIAQSLKETYPSIVPPLVLRSMPFYTEQPFRAAASPLKILYSGVICPDRGLETLIQAMGLSQKPHLLTLRGPGEEGYLLQLQALIKRLGIEDRVTLEQPVPFGEIIPCANAFDIGFSHQPPVSFQKLHSLPNKFFEYMMAGLALVVGDLPEMAKLLRAHDVGVLVPYDAQRIAQAFDALTPEQVDQYKKNSLVAARELCWEVEQLKLDAFFERLED